MRGKCLPCLQGGLFPACIESHTTSKSKPTNSNVSSRSQPAHMPTYTQIGYSTNQPRLNLQSCHTSPNITRPQPTKTSTINPRPSPLKATLLKNLTKKPTETN